MPSTAHSTESHPSHLLVYNDPARPVTPGGVGWLLVTVTGTRRPSTVTLAAHGADRHAGPRAAKEVAGRILRERGHAVVDWHDRSHAPPVYRAVLHDEHAAVGGTVPADDAPVMRVRRLGRPRPR